MTLIDFNKKELHDIYSSLQYTRLEIGFESKSEEELYDRLTKLMDKVAKLRQVCDCGGQSNWYIIMKSRELSMSDEEIKTFITTFKSYMERASVSELNYIRRESNRRYREMYYQSQAKKLNVSFDYYISEFT